MFWKSYILKYIKFIMIGSVKMTKNENKTKNQQQNKAPSSNKSNSQGMKTSQTTASHKNPDPRY
jgi:hypothetical protein